MKTTSLRARTLACALLATTAYCGLTAQPAAAQPAYRALDSNGVDLTHGDFVMSLVEGSIGSGDGTLTLVRDGVWSSGYNGHVWDSIMLSESLSNRSVSFGQRAEYFTGTSSQQSNGSTLTFSDDAYVHRSADGTTTVFQRRDPDCTPSSSTSCQWLPSSITTPDGRQTVLGWDPWTICPDVPIDQEVHCTVDSVRLGGIANSQGYSIAFTYAAGGSGGSGGPSLDWFRRTRADFYNLVAGSSPQASVTYSYPSTGVTEVTDTGGWVWRISGSFNHVTAIRRPGASSDTTTIAYGTGNAVGSVTSEGVTTAYSRVVNGTNASMTVTQVDGDPNTADPQTLVVSDLGVGRPTSVADPLGRTTSYQYDSSGRLTRVTQPEGNYVQYSYDARGNVTETRLRDKAGNSANDIVTSASYDTSCSSPVTCNSPNSVTDALGNVADYTYDSTHGGVLTATGPAPTSGAVRPQLRYSYTLHDDVEYRLTGTSQCRTTSSCAGGADEVKTAIAYDSNGNVVSASSGSGDGALTATTTMAWDSVGNLAAVDGPLAGTADTSHIRYDSARRIVATISADPEGAGPLKPRAVHNSYADGLLVKVEQGNVANQSDDLATFAAAQDAPAVETVYENARPVATKLVGGTTVYALTQIHYDALGRPDCTAQRMDMNDFGSALPDACTPTSPAGAQGPDRIAKTFYDAAGQVTKVQSAVGTSDQADEVAITYTDNGLVQTVTDGENNKTTYVHDGFDRLSRTQYPSATRGAGTSNSSDYEQLGYDAGSNVTSFRNRAGETIGYSYDALGRLTAKDLPGSEPDIAYAYDLLGQTTSAAMASQTLAFAYDALGRQLSQTDGSRVYSSQYDLAGRRTRLTHPDGFFVDQEYLVTGEMTKIRENGATSGVGVLASYDYDDLGRRKRLTLGNGDVADYGYDAVSRLHTLGHDLVAGGSANDLTITLAYNPASQIVSRVASNNLYAWTGHGNGSTTETPDGLNRLTQRGSIAYSHDARSNRLNDGARTYFFDSENKGRGVAAAPNQYDPLGRLAGAGSPLAIAYENYVDGLIAERYPNNSNLLNRHVFGPDVDEPLVWYNGSGTTDRRFLHADERGSIVSVTDGSGGLLAITRYDEYGKTQTSGINYGRFLYTGQRYFSSQGIYFYKNRMYDPGAGRFLQPDPIEYGSGMNLYAYVGGDPVNWIDPLGLAKKCLSGPSGDIVCTGRSGGGGGAGGAGGGAGRGTSPSGMITAATPAILIGGDPPPPGNPATDCGEMCAEITGHKRGGVRISLVLPFFPTPVSFRIPNILSSPSPDPGDACGSKGSDRVPDQTGGADLTAACLRHDRCYASDTPKRNCDSRFLTEVKDACMETRVGPIPCYGLGVVYFLGVSFGGGDAYRAGHRR
jgi:RHS repeat-associated protein